MRGGGVYRRNICRCSQEGREPTNLSPPSNGSQAAKRTPLPVRPCCPRKADSRMSARCNKSAWYDLHEPHVA